MALKPEIVLNGSLDSWSSPTDADQWGEPATSGGTINRDGVDQFAGAFCCRITKTSGSPDSVRFEQAWSNVFIPGKWYRIQYYTKTDGIPANDITVRIVNDTQGTLKYWSVANQAWEIGATDLPAEIGTTYVRHTVWIFTHPSFSQSDQIRFFFRNDNDASGSFFQDEVSIRGPYDVPIIEITGTIRSPSGAALVGTGVITARLNGVGQVSDGTDNRTIPPAPQAFPVVDGVVAMSLIPITNITLENGETPLWSVSYDLPGYPPFTESWNLGLESPIDITQVPKV